MWLENRFEAATKTPEHKKVWAVELCELCAGSVEIRKGWEYPAAKPELAAVTRQSISL